MSDDLLKRPPCIALLRSLALRPHTGGDLRGPYAQLFAAVISLLESYGLALRRPSCFDLSTWDLTTLEGDLRQALGAGRPHWENTSNLAIWSFGFYVNCAQTRVANTIDRSLNLWIERMKPQEAKQLKKERVRERVTLLETDARLPTTRQLATPFGKSLKQYNDIEKSAEYVRKALADWRGQWSPPEQVLDAGFGAECYSGQDCAAVTWSRVNKFKHAPTGTQDKVGPGLLIEWVITAQAVRWTTEFMWAIQSEAQDPA